MDVPYFRLLFDTIENMTVLLEKDDKESYLRFMEDAFTCMDKYHDESSMRLAVAEMEKLLDDKTVGQAKDRALLLDYQAALVEQFSHQTVKAIRLEKEALSMLPEINADNALLASNLHANLGALYRADRKNELAAEYMEKGIEILNKYHLVEMNETIAQICNYAVLLHDMGKPDRGLTALRKCAKIVREYNSELSSDYAVLHEAMGGISLACDRLDKTKEHLQTAMGIYEQLWADEPELIEAKYSEIQNQYAATGLNIGKQLLS